MTKYKIVNVEISNLHKQNNFKSEVVSQALIWENLQILEYKDNWCKIRQWDNYEGWIHKNYLVDEDVYTKNKLSNSSLWYTVSKRIIKVNELYTNITKYLSFGSVIPVIKKEEDNYIVLFPNEKKYYINKNNLVEFNNKLNFKNIVNLAFKNIGTPYMWGGKSGFGYDCSGFVQSLYRFAKINLPRDSKDQALYEKLIKVEKNYKSGDLIFFQEYNNIVHVGMLVDECNFIHCSGEVKINSLNKDDVNFCKEIYAKLHGIYRCEE